MPPPDILVNNPWATAPTASQTSYLPDICTGPVGLSMTLPAYWQGQTQSTAAHSMCNGTNMYSLWQLPGGQLVQCAMNSQGEPTWRSWIFMNETGATQGTGVAYQWASASSANGVLFTPPRPRPRHTPAIIRAGRRSAWKSISIYARFRGMEEASRFLRGEPVRYEGHRFDYQVQKTRKVLQHAMDVSAFGSGGHIPYSLRVLEKVTGRVLGSGCVYINDTPIFDQLLAVTFHVQDPVDEDRFIKATNWTWLHGNPMNTRRNAAARVAAAEGRMRALAALADLDAVAQRINPYRIAA